MMPKTWNEEMNCVIERKKSAGVSSGIVMKRNRPHAEAPSIFAAS